MIVGLRSPRVPLSGLRLAVAAIVALAVAMGAALAQEPGSRARDSSQPIEINADRLEVQQDKNVAIFSGNVVAVQGGIRLRADTLRVYYRKAAEGADEVTAAISRIDAIGNVFISSPTETAEGRVGIYDVESRVITLTGSVVLTRGENVIRGERVVLDLAKGLSRMEAGEVAGQQQRVRALFVPPKKKPAE